MNVILSYPSPWVCSTFKRTGIIKLDLVGKQSQENNKDGTWIIDNMVHCLMFILIIKQAGTFPKGYS